jgi:hypothetical protein
MRALMLTGVMMLGVACTAAKGGSRTVEFTTIASGAYAASDAKKAVVATSDAEYQRLWTELIGTNETAPPADLAAGTVIFLLAGSRPTGGYTVVVESVSVDGDGVAVVLAPVNAPRPRGMVTQALTSPYAVAFVRDRGIKTARWDE